MARKVGVAAGNRGKGRKKGVPNKVTASIKAAICEAFDKHGGVPALVKWAKENETEFYKLWGRLAPTEIVGDPKAPIVLRVEYVEADD